MKIGQNTWMLHFPLCAKFCFYILHQSAYSLTLQVPI
ncbi:hypothetical protein EG68_02940 [Paragonimus skrjabini miyazakii]|uniref:Uncharacterized protein n=1 Tax=Paragonimus skrjabini miyazakii TaxID=59628 RepID=A0A8S9Z810_9TREM|nr:hypothetical protein EG68_02940 [Paragonimus skrjabini miyazakii]